MDQFLQKHLTASANLRRNSGAEMAHGYLLPPSVIECGQPLEGLDLGWSVSVVKQSVKGLMAEGCPDGLPEIRATNPSLEGVWPAILMSPTVHSLYHSDLLSKDSRGSFWEILVGQTIVPSVVAAHGPSPTPWLAPLLVLVTHLVAWPRPLSLRALGSWSHALLRTELLHLPFTITFR